MRDSEALKPMQSGGRCAQPPSAANSDRQQQQATFAKNARRMSRGPRYSASSEMEEQPLAI